MSSGMATTSFSGGIDQVRSYWDRRPCNRFHSQADLGSLDYSRQVTRRKYFVEPHIPGFAQFERWNQQSVLELGCGIGTDTIEFAKAGATVTAVDISQESINIARARMASESVAMRGPGQATFHCEDIEELPSFHTDACFDLVYSFGVLHHTPSPRAALRRARSLIRSGGELRIMVYNRLSWKVFWILARFGRLRFWDWRRLIPKYSEAQTGCPITWTYTKSSLAQLLRQCDFEPISIQPDHIFPYRIAEYKKHKYARAFPWSIITGMSFHVMERLMGWHLLAIARPM